MKRKDGAYVLVKRYAKERHNEHRKGNGKEDFYEPEYISKNPNEFVDKVNNFRKSLPTMNETPSHTLPLKEEGEVPPSSAITTSDMPAYMVYGAGPKKRIKES